ncbi:hypothetical protein [Brachyspira pilosicoli]|uniref:Uncharacterized protein n=1 Tax=Brachyspira pilosicoli TaxID=52584 RepID=A0AAJ6G9B8_BRAPL|nr:hypothetical protein [Brachyspira pilosicoli]WIH87930.1 hypothetical protein NEI05_10610 [Brachyspira pilosicoli]WIH90210.1 hypothetical protein NEI02_10950 [Brachyspira pilosicoli]WIH92501.1 hypothetical protein NEI01_10925 [Brachyspira pilosicoli]WIH94793.1 hypothetical protein NEH99_10920 [Brachyspira pilosicoli]
MNNDKKQKIIKTLLSLMISFLMIFIVAMFARVASNTVLPQNSKVSVLINDYLDMMMEMMDKFATNLKIKRNTVSEYQVNLITQSISDYVGYSMYQTADILKDYNPYKNYSKTELEKYKNDYYKMTLENPYLRSMTVFSIDGKMRLNLYSANHKSWPIELQDNLLKEVKNKGSLVLNAENENAFYIMEYIKNKYGEIIVTTRNDYSYVSDIAMYYQVADKRLYISDSRDLVYNVRESIGEKSIEKVSSVINRFAYYKKQPSFIVNDSLSVSMIGKEYPNYFELIVLAVTALLILLFQLILTGIINFFKYLMQIKTHRDFLESVKGENELFIDESLVKADIPKSTAIDDMPPIIEKLHYKIPEKYFDNNKKEEENKFNIAKDISNIVSMIKFNNYDPAKDNNEEINAEEKITEEIKDISIENEDNLNNIYSLSYIENEVDKELENDKNEDSIEFVEEEKIDDEILEYNDNSTLEEIYKTEEYDEYNSEYNNDEYKIESVQNDEDDIYNNNDEEIKALVQESEEEYQNYQESENNDEYYSLNAEYSNNNEYFNNEDIRDRKIIKSDLQLSYNEYSNENIFNSKEEIEKINDDVEEIENVQEKIEEEEEVKENINMDIYNSYGIENNDEEKIKNIDTKRTEDVFAAFDKMLSSIISKAEEDARKSITKK